MSFRQGPPNQHYGGGNNRQHQHPRQDPRGSPPSQHNLSQSPPSRGFGRPTANEEPPLHESDDPETEKPIPPPEPVVVEEILEKNNYNPPELNLDRIDLAR